MSGFEKSRGLTLVLAAVLLSILAAGCTNTFGIMKDGKSYFFGSNKEGFRKMLCESGDLKAILADTQLTQTAKDDFYKYNCISTENSKEKVAAIYASITPEQRRELRLAFQKHGYDVNNMAC